MPGAKPVHSRFPAGNATRSEPSLDCPVGEQDPFQAGRSRKQPEPVAQRIGVPGSGRRGPFESDRFEQAASR